MNKTVLQVPLSKELKVNAEKAATMEGFSSLQEVVRVFLVQLATQRISIKIEETRLSRTNENRYIAMTSDFESGRNTYSSKNVKNLVSQLNDN